MVGIDWVVLGLYILLTMGIGLYLSRRASASIEDYFVSGRKLPWWLAGTSMAATTFSIDTPLYVAGVVGSRGIAGNWEWWAFGFGHVLLIYVFARLWRRSEVITDAELVELRYSGRPAALLRGVKAFLFAVPINCIGLGYVMLAGVKVVETLALWNMDGEVTAIWGIEPRLFFILMLSVFVLVYTGFSGLWGVVATDFLQFFLALGGAIIVAVVAIRQPEIGGLSGLVEKAQEVTSFDVLAFIPVTKDPDSWLGVGWGAFAGISATTFCAYVFLQWWTFRRSDGGGEFVQRLISARDEQEAVRAAWLFNALHYMLRTWPWILVALAALVLYPDLEDKELGYPMLMLDLLPAGILGIVVASLLAAFMSTVSTNINWGASYLVNDLYRRFLRPEAGQQELVLMGRLFSAFILFTGALAAMFFDSVGELFRLVISIGTGPGMVLILRWFWWRINAWAELAAMVAGFIVGLFTTVVPLIQIADFGQRLFLITAITTVVWVVVMLLTRPEEEEVLEAFYIKVRPAGPGWKKQRAATGQEAELPIRFLVGRFVAGSAVLFGGMFLIGAIILLQWSIAGWLLLLTVTGIGGLFWVGKRERTF